MYAITNLFLSLLGLIIRAYKAIRNFHTGRAETVEKATVVLPRVENSVGPYWWEQLEGQEEISDLEIKLLVALTIPNQVEDEVGECDEFDTFLKYNHFSEEEMIAALNASTRRF